jgi:hypothetical protein
MDQRDLWGPYGDVLVSGYFERKDEQRPALLFRTGPFLPPIWFPYCTPANAVIVTESFKHEIEGAGIPQLEFRKAILNRIVPHDWDRWDFQSAEPKVYPPEGEPENYIWEEKHSRRCAGRMEDVWEVSCPIIPAVYSTWLDSPNVHVPEERRTLVLADTQYEGLFLPAAGELPVVDEATKQWFESNVGEWVCFIPLDLKADPNVLEKLDELRRVNGERGPHLTEEKYRKLIESFCEENGYIVPPAFYREDLCVGRYCIVRMNTNPPRLSAATYDNYSGVAVYLENRIKTSPMPEEELSQLLVYDLERRRHLEYKGDGQFESK